MTSFCQNPSVILSTHTHARRQARTHSLASHSAVLSAGSQQARSLSGPVKWLAQHCTLLPHLFSVSILTQPYVSYTALMIERLAKDCSSSWYCHWEIKIGYFQDGPALAERSDSLEGPRNIWLTDNVSAKKAWLCICAWMFIKSVRDKHRHFKGLWLNLKTWSPIVFSASSYINACALKPHWKNLMFYLWKHAHYRLKQETQRQNLRFNHLPDVHLKSALQKMLLVSLPPLFWGHRW